MIVITTPTGQIGREVIDTILDSDGIEPVRVIARDPARLSPRVREHEGVEVVPGSHGDIDVLTKAFAGADAVFWLVPPNPRADSVEGHVLGFTRAACEAFGSQGVRRVVGVSTLTRRVGRNAGHLSAARAMDELIASTGVSYRSLQAPSFMENFLRQVETIRSQGVFFEPVRTDKPLRTVATRDIAAAAARLLLDGSWSGQDAVPVVGPDELSPDGMARVMSEVLGRPVRCQQVGLADHKATMMRHGATEGSAQGLIDMAAAIEAGVYDYEVGPRTATSFRQWCEEVLRPAVLA